MAAEPRSTALSPQALIAASIPLPHLIPEPTAFYPAQPIWSRSGSVLSTFLVVSTLLCLHGFGKLDHLGRDLPPTELAPSGTSRLGHAGAIPPGLNSSL